MQASVHSSSALSSALERLDPIQERWLAIVRRAQTLPDGLQPRDEPLPSSQSLHLTAHGAASHIDIALSAGQWPQLHALQSLHDAGRRDAATNLLLADMAALLRNAGCPIESFSGLTDGPGHIANRSAVRIAVRIGEFAVDLMPEESATPFARALEAALIAQMPPSPRLLRWPLRTCVALGGRRIARARFAALQPGDAVFGGFMDPVQLCIVSGRSRTRVARARLDKQEAITMTDPFEEKVEGDHGAMAVAETATQDGGLRALAMLPMEIRYEIDGPDLTVAQAAALVPGDVLVLPVSADRAVVHLRCRGRTIARGELVNVGGQLGVRITEAGEHT